MSKITLSVATLTLGAFAAISTAPANAAADLSGFHGVVVMPPGPPPFHPPRPCSGPPMLGVSVQPQAPIAVGGAPDATVHGVVVGPQPPIHVCPL